MTTLGEVTSPIDEFSLGQRVLVCAVIPRAHAETIGLPVPVGGTVVRLLTRDDSAWIRLDHRISDELLGNELHPFPASDPHNRGTNVLAWPEDCRTEP